MIKNELGDELNGAQMDLLACYDNLARVLADRGDQLNAAQMDLLACYDNLARVLADRGDQLAPYEKRNALKALGALWQIQNGLDMDRGQIYHLGA